MIKVNNVKVCDDCRTVEVRDGRVYIDGNLVNAEGKEITVYVQGSPDTIRIDACDKVLVEGDVQNLSTSVGNVGVRGGVNGSVKTMSGNASTGDVGGDVKTMSGDVTCGKVAGKVKTMSGDVTIK